MSTPFSKRVLHNLQAREFLILRIAIVLGGMLRRSAVAAICLRLFRLSSVFLLSGITTETKGRRLFTTLTYVLPTLPSPHLIPFRRLSLSEDEDILQVRNTQHSLCDERWLDEERIRDLNSGRLLRESAKTEH